MAAYDQGPARPRAPSDYTGYPHESSESRSPISNILKNIGGAKQTKDGQPQKRRGPKPDSKPPLTHRQALNRQAQRTHRERKEMYTKALEAEVLRLKELFANATVERDAAFAEIQRLQGILRAAGIPYGELATPSASNNTTFPSYHGSSNGSVAGSRRQDSNTTAYSPSPLNSRQSPAQMQTGHGIPMPNNNLDYDQLGIDFVLTLERPCMDHMQYLVVRSHNAEGQPHHHPMERPDDMDHEHMSGHALMATCPPFAHVMEKPGEPYPHRMPDLPRPDLMKLLQASAYLPVSGGELTPVQAWMMITHSPRFPVTTQMDIELIQAELLKKVRCYGFGAVLEDFEITSAIDRVFEGRDSIPSVNGVGNQAYAYHNGHNHVMA